MSDDTLLDIPYARLVQAIRLAAERATQDARARLREAAFVGWQVRTALVGTLGGGRGASFREYLEQLGLDDDSIEARQQRAPRARALANADKVREAFRAGRMKRVE